MISVGLKIKKGTAVKLLFILAAAVFIICLRLSFGRVSAPAAVECAELPEYFRSFGIEVDEESKLEDTVTVPDEFSAVYENYNKIQRAGGFDLEKYKGQSLQRITYKVINFPENSDNVFVEVLQKDGMTVAADVYSTDADGFMKSLK